MQESASLSALTDLCTYVADTLSRLESLDRNQFELARQTLYRGGQPCGVYFCLQGPRALCLSAVWETERNVIYFYDSCGRRVQRTKLKHAPPAMFMGSGDSPPRQLAQSQTP